MGGGLTWIPDALSTIKPTTSPHLSAIQLGFARQIVANQQTVESIGSDIRRTADEVARIEWEFKGAVKPTVQVDPVFKAVLDRLNLKLGT